MDFLQRSDKTTDPNYTATSLDINDTIASLEWCSEAESLLACSSWDKNISIYDVGYRTVPSFTGTTTNTILSLERKYLTSTEYPCVALSWRKELFEEPQLLAGSIDGTLYLISHTRNLISPIGKHNDAITEVFWVGDNKAISISLDKECKLWDMRNNSPIKSFYFPAKVACADFCSPCLALAFNDQKICVLDTNELFAGAASLQIVNLFLPSPFGDESYISSLSLSKENTLSLGSLDGRGNISNIEKAPNGMYWINPSLTFRAHILEPGVFGNNTGRKIMFPIHSVGFHPQNKDTMITAGGDGNIHFWNIQEKTKIKSLLWFGIPIAKAKISPGGKFLAYGLGYDWSKGIEGAQSFKNQLCVHEIQPNELAQSSVTRR